MFETTYHGLMKWYCHEIEKFGWMVVFAQNEEDIGHKQRKLALYIETLNELILSIESKAMSIREDDRRNDLLIIHNRLTKFIPIAEKTLKKFELIGGSKKISKKSSKKKTKK